MTDAQEGKERTYFPSFAAVKCYINKIIEEE